MAMNHDRLNDYICKLKILSKLSPREKIIIHERTIEIVDYTTYNLARLKKAINLENRWHMIVKLEAMYHDIESIVDNLVNNPPNREPEQDILFALDRLRHDLDGSLQGLYNLIVTYNTNKSATSRLEVLYEYVKILSSKINRYFEKKEMIDRKYYGIENVYEESNKVKQINEFDPKKPELQVRGNVMETVTSSVRGVYQKLSLADDSRNNSTEETTRPHGRIPSPPPPPPPNHPPPKLDDLFVRSTSDRSHHVKLEAASPKSDLGMRPAVNLTNDNNQGHNQHQGEDHDEDQDEDLDQDDSFTTESPIAEIQVENSLSLENPSIMPLLAEEADQENANDEFDDPGLGSEREPAGPKIWQAQTTSQQKSLQNKKGRNRRNRKR